MSALALCQSAFEIVHQRSSFREDIRSRGWMPRRCVPMKDVALLR